MIPNLIIKPISENVIIVILSSGITIQMSDSGGIGGNILIAEKEEDLRFARFKQIGLITKEANAAGVFRVEMKTGVRP